MTATATSKSGLTGFPSRMPSAMRLYNLLGALFAPSDLPQSSHNTNKLFTRISGLIKDRFADPDFGPAEAASESGISLRYVQKLFLQRGLRCTEFIYSLRLDQAARLLNRRKLLRTNEPLSTIAYACGFRDYTHFARKFRHRFGYSPSPYCGAQDLARNGAVRLDPGDSASTGLRTADTQSKIANPGSGT